MSFSLSKVTLKLDTHIDYFDGCACRRLSMELKFSISSRSFQIKFLLQSFSSWIPFSVICFLRTPDNVLKIPDHAVNETISPWKLQSLGLTHKKLNFIWQDHVVRLTSGKQAHEKRGCEINDMRSIKGFMRCEEKKRTPRDKHKTLNILVCSWRMTTLFCVTFQKHLTFRAVST